MEQVNRMRLIHRQQLEDVPELIQRMQLESSPKDAARTCILSKSWLHAWHTNPYIRFCPPSLKKEHHRDLEYMRWIHLTLLSYHRDNLPITGLDLQLGIHTTHRAVKTLIMQATSKTSHKELHLTILAVSFTLPDEIFSSENLYMLSLELISPLEKNHSLHISSNPAIQCTNLRVLELSHVHISQYVLNQLISKNKLLEKIILQLTQGLKEIKVHNLRYLREFIVYLSNGDHWIDILEFDDVPSLRSLVYKSTILILAERPSLFKMFTIGSLRELHLDNVYMDDAFSNMIKSNFPCLEELTLEIKRCSGEILDITCLTLRKLMLDLALSEEIKVQVYAPNLLTYRHVSSAVPSLLFTASPPKQIVLSLTLVFSIDESFSLKMREALKLSCKFNIELNSFDLGDFVPFNIDDLKAIVPYPATNVEELILQEHLVNNVFWGNSLPFDAVFSICHPMYTKANDELRLKVANYFLKLILKGVMENCEIRNPLDGIWVALTSSSLSLLDTTTPRGFYEFKLSWCSP